jgi:hypothetical protein
MKYEVYRAIRNGLTEAWDEGKGQKIMELAETFGETYDTVSGILSLMRTESAKQRAADHKVRRTEYLQIYLQMVSDRKGPALLDLAEELDLQPCELAKQVIEAAYDSINVKVRSGVGLYVCLSV